MSGWEGRVAMDAAKPAGDEVNFTDKKVEVPNFDRYKGAKGRTDRLAILSTNLYRVWTHYPNSQTVKGYIRCMDPEGRQQKCCEKFGPPEQRFGMVLFQYNTNEKGELPDEKRCGGVVRLWVVSGPRYETLKGMSKEFQLLDEGADKPQHDFLSLCTEEKFQRLNFTPCKEAHWKKQPNWYAFLKGKEKEALTKLPAAIGKTLTDQDKEDLFGANSPVPTKPPTGSGDVDLDAILDE